MRNNHLESYLEKWDLKSPKLIAETNTSQIYRVRQFDKNLVLNLLNTVGQVDEKNGGYTLEYFSGIGAVDLIRHDESAHLISFADGGLLKTLCLNGQDELATEIIGNLLNKIHRKTNKKIPVELTLLKDRYRKLFMKEYISKEPEFERAARIAQKLLSSPVDSVVLHGDVHHENIINDSKKGWVVLDPKGLVGERTFDALNSLFNPHELDSLVINENRLIQTATKLANIMKIDLSRLLRFAFTYGCLSAVWSIEDGNDHKETMSIVRIIEKNIR